MHDLLQQYSELIATTIAYIHQEHPITATKVETPPSAVSSMQRPPHPSVLTIKLAAVDDQYSPLISPKTIPSPSYTKNTASSTFAKPTLPTTRQPLIASPSSKFVDSKSKTDTSSQDFFKLQPMSAAPIESFDDVRAFVSQWIPSLTLVSTIPDDAVAQKINSAPEYADRVPTIVLLSFATDSPAVIKLLQNLIQAIDLYVRPAKIIDSQQLEIEGNWLQLLKATQLQLVILCQQSLNQLPGLRAYYRQDKESGLSYLQDTPLLLLEDPTLYLKNPQLKASLWDAINDALAE